MSITYWWLSTHLLVAEYSPTGGRAGERHLLPGPRLPGGRPARLPARQLRLRLRLPPLRARGPPAVDARMPANIRRRRHGPGHIDNVPAMFATARAVSQPCDGLWPGLPPPHTPPRSAGCGPLTRPWSMVGGPWSMAWLAGSEACGPCYGPWPGLPPGARPRTVGYGYGCGLSLWSTLMLEFTRNSQSGEGGWGGARLADSETRRGAFLLQNGFRSANFVPSLFVVCVQNSRNRQHGGQRPLSYQTDAIVVSVSVEPSCDTVAARCAASLAAAEIRFVDVIVAP